jgi:hypothetical protein
MSFVFILSCSLGDHGSRIKLGEQVNPAVMSSPRCPGAFEGGPGAQPAPRFAGAELTLTRHRPEHQPPSGITATASEISSAASKITAAGANVDIAPGTAEITAHV